MGDAAAPRQKDSSLPMKMSVVTAPLPLLLLLLLLLLSGWVPLCRGGAVRLHAIATEKTWPEARDHCREAFADLATVGDQYENAEAVKAAGNGTFWIGLFYSGWRWSEEGRNFSSEAGFTGWAAGEPQPGKCVAVSWHGGWSARDCGALYHASCYEAETGRHVLVKPLMNWTAAQNHCRSAYADLSSVDTQQDNYQVADLLKTPLTRRARRDEDDEEDDEDDEEDDEDDEEDEADSGRFHVSKYPAWIGLHRDFWTWSDGGDLEWAEPKLEDRDECVMLDTNSSDWIQRNCSERHPFLCYSIDVRLPLLRLLRVQMSSASADLSDPMLQLAVLHQLQKRLAKKGEEATLRWKRQPDGKVFHQEEKRRRQQAAPPGGACVTL